MDEQFINLSPENLSKQHLCCIIRSKKPHPGVEAKRQWLAQRLREGHVFRKLDAKATVFIEYAPLGPRGSRLPAATFCTSTVCGCWATIRARAMAGR